MLDLVSMQHIEIALPASDRLGRLTTGMMLEAAALQIFETLYI